VTHNQKKISNLVGILLEWFSKNARDLPWRRTKDPYCVYVSEIMLQQTQVKTVIPYWDRWMRELPTIESLAKANPEKIHKLWEGLGYYTRVRNMQRAAQEIIAKGQNGVYARPHPGPLPRGEGETLSRVQKTRCAETQSNSCKFPNTFDEVLALSGIGRYTAGAICSIAFNQPTPILDGNVIRVLTRVFGIAENPKEKTANAKLWNLAEELVIHASRFTSHASPCSHLNQSLMELGALICTPRDPKCLACPISKHCFAFQNNRVSDFPNLEKRAAPTQRRFAAFVLENRGKFLVRQRPAGVVNAHLWEFPNIELNGAPTNPAAAAQEIFGSVPKNLQPLCTIKHSITRYRITVEAFRAEASTAAANRLKAELQTQWLPLSELHKLSFPSAHKKILTALQRKV
jgi:A/G-specific adenine glycosylase